MDSLAARGVPREASFDRKATRPCPCGWKGHPTRPCLCSPSSIQRYQSRASGPLLDRIDLCISVPPIQPSELGTVKSGITTQEASAAVSASREIQYQRWNELLKTFIPPRENAKIPARHLERFCTLDAKCKKILEHAMERLGLSMRAYGRTLRVARTIADLENCKQINAGHMAEALSYRVMGDAPIPTKVY